MEKYVDCHNCQNKYDCERTYLGGCTDGKEWDQEEKKLSDKEIVLALEKTKITLDELKEDDDDYEKLLLIKKITNCFLDLIRRLQYAYSSASKSSEEWKAKYEKERKENAEQKAEIERLTEENKAIRINCENARNITGQMFDKNDELQKQVDELKLELQGQFDKGVKAGCLMSKVKEQQAVKDTAKEIFTDLLKEFSIRKSCGNADVVVREMASRKGVEVE